MRGPDLGRDPAEATATFAGDELLDPADIVATRAIEIEAPPSAIWPWLVQMGPGRAGAYTYDWIENLFGLNMHSADRINPEWQDLKVGDVVRSGPDKPGEHPLGLEDLDPHPAIVRRQATGCGRSRSSPPTARPG